MKARTLILWTLAAPLALVAAAVVLILTALGVMGGNSRATDGDDIDDDWTADDE